MTVAVSVCMSPTLRVRSEKEMVWIWSPPSRISKLADAAASVAMTYWLDEELARAKAPVKVGSTRPSSTA